MTKAEIIELIQNTYDPTPRHLLPNSGWDDGAEAIADKIVAAIAAREAEIAELKKQLPDEMKHCTIVFEECEKGHGGLRGTNWVKNPCPWCTIATLQAQLASAREALDLAEELACNCGAGHGSLEGHVDWCAWLKIERRAALAASAGTGEKQEKQMDDSQIRYMVDRFLGWKLPQNFNPDAGISYAPLSYADKCPPTGTNLLDATQAEAMIRYLVEGLPPLANQSSLSTRLRAPMKWSR
jgi:hypothetical protein